MSTQEVIKEHDNLLEASHFAVGQLHRSLSHERSTGVGAAVAMLEAMIVIGAGILAYSGRGFLADLVGVSQMQGNLPRVRLFVFLLTYACLTVICNAAQNLYSEAAIRSARVTRVRILKGFMVSSMMAIMIVFIAGETTVPRLMVADTALFSLVGVVFIRYVMERYNLKRIEHGIGNQHVLIVGAGEVGQAFRLYLQNHIHLGKTFCGFVDWEPEAGPYCLGRIGVKVVPDLYGGLAVGAGMAYIGSVPVLELNRQPIPALGLFLKRIMDLSIGVITLVVTAPILLLAAMAIKIDSPGPALYRAWRVGRKGRKFRCYKFRTMVVVLKGDMSIVGPRPHPEDDFKRYDLAHFRRLDVTPGLTGLWQVTARRDPSFEKNVLLDLEYIENWDVLLDLKILLKTIPEVFGGSGH